MWLWEGEGGGGGGGGGGGRTEGRRGCEIVDSLTLLARGGMPE